MVVISVIAECPECSQVNRLWQTAAYSAFYMSAWTDGWVSPQLMPPPLLKCSRCHHLAYRDSFSILGPLRLPERWGDLHLIQAQGATVPVMKVLREVLKVSMAEARRLATELPATVLSRALAEEARDLGRKLVQAGGEVRGTEWEEGESSPREWLEASDAEAVEDPDAIQAFLRSREGILRKQEAEIRLYLFHLWNHPYRNEGNSWVPIHGRPSQELGNARRLVEVLDVDSPDELLLKAEVLREMECFREAAALLELAPGGPEPARETLLSLIEARSSELEILAVSA